MFNLKNMNSQWNNGGQPSLQNLQQPMYQQGTQQQNPMQAPPQAQMPQIRTMPYGQFNAMPYRQSSNNTYGMSRADPYSRLEEIRRKRRLRQLQSGFQRGNNNPFSLRGIY